MQQGYNTRRTDLDNSVRKSINSQTNKQLLCKFHPNNELHTFCISPQCMLPMCSACIGVHNEDHFETKTHGSFKDLQQLIRDTLQTIEEQQTVLQQLSSQYVQDYNSKLAVPQKCKQILRKARVKAHQQLDRVFDRFSLDMQQKMCNFTQQINEFYNSLEERIHNNYKILAKNKQDLNLAFSNYIFNSTKNSFSHRSNNHSSPNLNLSNQFFKSVQTQRNDQKKQQRRILKTLIQFHSYKFDQINHNKIVKLKQQIKQLKTIIFDVDCDILQINKHLSNICNSSIRIRNSLQFRQDRLTSRKKQAKFVNSIVGQTQSQIMIETPKPQIDKTKQSNERLKKMQQGNLNGQSRKRNEKMQSPQDRQKNYIYSNNNMQRPQKM